MLTKMMEVQMLKMFVEDLLEKRKRECIVNNHPTMITQL